MIAPYVNFLATMLLELQAYIDQFEKAEEADPKTIIGEEGVEIMNQRLAIFANYARLTNLSDSLGLVPTFRYHVTPGTRSGDVKNRLRELRDTFLRELARRHFFFVKPDAVQHYEEPRQGWGDVPAKITGTAVDIEEAERCFALERYTACVFHLMRVAEIGLRTLARKARVKVKKRPLDWAEWGELLRELRKVAEGIAQRPRGPAREETLEFYRGTLGEFEAFKDVYRNQVMHSRTHYNRAQASSVLLHVSEFMQRFRQG